jgi:hypothetical protein
VEMMNLTLNLEVPCMFNFFWVSSLVVASFLSMLGVTLSNIQTRSSKRKTSPW